MDRKGTNEPLFPVGSSNLHLATHLFSPTRLTLARELRGLTKAELASRIQKTPAAVGQFEAGRAKPEAKTVAAMALALGVPVGFFAYRPGATPLMTAEECHFRSLRAASQRERRRVLAAGVLLCDLVTELEEEIEFPHEQVSSAACTATTAEDIEQCAAAVRRHWGLGLGPIPNIVKLLESKGIIVTVVPKTCREIDAFSAWHTRRPIIFLVDHTEPSRVRYDAAHELGHLVMHVDVTPGSPELERQANRFAAAFLLPRESFLPECPGWLNWDHFYELKQRWRVSVQALVRRAYDLGRISEATYRRAFVQLNARNERLREMFEPPPEVPTMIANALQEVQQDLPLSKIAEKLFLSEADLSIINLQLSNATS
ncbi:ImmA/IrrE family metallo-endopeptidase [Sorangium sp. So ce1014]|uniref:ImmA/IrrE family metallo-endopeptidase n=1 Tax=Sorangium sp. So ce1014 TaxID=3133326 RepID=UPI003F61DAA9